MATEPGLVYLVTGGCGFLGRHLVRMLAERGDGIREIRVLDLKLDRELESLNTASLRVTLLQGDISCWSDVSRAVAGADLVFHAASVIDFLGLLTDSEVLSTNVQGTQLVIEACIRHGVQTLVYTSSIEVVGPNVWGQPFDRGNEETVYKVCHASVYPRSKTLAEELVFNANGIRTASGTTLSTCSLRPLGIYGEGHDLLRTLRAQASRCAGYLVRFIPIDRHWGRVYVGNVAWMHLLAARALRENPDLLGGQVYFCYDHSPDKSYLDFNMEFLGPCGVKLFGQRRPLLPFRLVYILAVLAELLCFLLRPLCTFAPYLNRYTLLLASTTFTVRTDKAARHFGYSPLYTWEEARARTVRWLQGLPLSGGQWRSH